MTKKQKKPKKTSRLIVDKIFFSPPWLHADEDKYLRSMDRIQERLIGKHFLMKIWVIE